MRSQQHDILFEPVTVGTKVFPNRFYSVPHATFVIGRRMSDIAFRRMKAEGGWGAVCGGVVSLRSDMWSGLVPRIFDADEAVMLGRMAQEIRGQGALAGMEIGVGGSRSEGPKFSPAFGVSQLSDIDRSDLVPREMDQDEIRGILDSWSAAAGMAADLGYEIVYAYGGHGTLPAQFLSPVLNRRTDRYGGSLENRARFWLELIDGVRQAVGDRAVVAVRLASESFSPYGAPIDDVLGFVEMADDMVDLWDVNVGFRWDRDSGPSRFDTEGYQVDFSGRVRSVTQKPIVGVSRLTSPDRMAAIVRSGLWDFIGAARPGIADPFLPRKIEEGRYDEVRECTGSNFCIAVETTGAGLSCVQNATIGEEYRRGWHPERFEPAADPERAILVVGAGPAGMECARVLGRRGFHNVHLVEAAADIGGHLSWIRRLPGLGDWGRVIDYRKVQLEALSNVSVVTGVTLDAADVLDYGASTVIAATGSRWLSAGEPWHLAPVADLVSERIPTLTPEDVMVRDMVPEGRRVVVWDADGTAVGAGLVELLTRRGCQVTFATRFGRAAPMLDASFEGGRLRTRLHDQGVSVLPGVTPVGFDDAGLILADGHGDEHTVDLDSFVLVAQRVSDNGLYRSLRSDPAALEAAGIAGLYRIGDAVAPRHFGFAVADGHRLGREIELENPAVPREPIVENDYDGSTAVFG